MAARLSNFKRHIFRRLEEPRTQLLAGRAIEILTITGAIYLVLTSCLSALQMYCERLTAYEQRGLGEGRRRRLRLDAPLPTLPA